MFALSDRYPPDAVAGADFLSLASQREIVDVGPGGELVSRMERVVIADRHYDAQDLVIGRPCFGEHTIRALAALVDLVDPVVVRRLQADRDRWQDRAVIAEGENVDLKLALETIDRLPVLRVYLATDGTEHSSAAAAIDHMAEQLGARESTEIPAFDQDDGFVAGAV